MALTNSERSRRYAQSHAEKLKAYRREYYQKNKEKILAYNKEYCAEYRRVNADKLRTYNRLLTQKHPERVLKYREASAVNLLRKLGYTVVPPEDRGGETPCLN